MRLCAIAPHSSARSSTTAVAYRSTPVAGGRSDPGAAEHLASVLARQAGLLERVRARASSAVASQGAETKAAAAAHDPRTPAPPLKQPRPICAELADPAHAS
jgi:hypothetical protein